MHPLYTNTPFSGFGVSILCSWPVGTRGLLPRGVSEQLRIHRKKITVLLYTCFHEHAVCERLPGLGLETFLCEAQALPFDHTDRCELPA